jgi:hypothetical protein
MKIPGFTAEASLYKTRKTYNSADAARRLAKADGIIPQARILDGFCIGNGSYCCFRGPDGKWSCGRTIST